MQKFEYASPTTKEQAVALLAKDLASFPFVRDTYLRGPAGAPRTSRCRLASASMI